MQMEMLVLMIVSSRQSWLALHRHALTWGVFDFIAVGILKRSMALAINSILMSLLAWTTGLIVPRAASAMYAMVGAMIGSWNATELNSENYLQLIEGDIERRTVAESQRQV